MLIEFNQPCFRKLRSTLPTCKWKSRTMRIWLWLGPCHYVYRFVTYSKVLTLIFIHWCANFLEPVILTFLRIWRVGCFDWNSSLFSFWRSLKFVEMFLAVYCLLKLMLILCVSLLKLLVYRLWRTTQRWACKSSYFLSTIRKTMEISLSRFGVNLCEYLLGMSWILLRHNYINGCLRNWM